MQGPPRCRSVLRSVVTLVSHVSSSVERGLVFRCLRPSAQHTGSFPSISVLVTRATGLPLGFSEPSRHLGFDLLILLLEAQVGVLQGLQPREEGQHLVIDRTFKLVPLSDLTLEGLQTVLQQSLLHVPVRGNRAERRKLW